MTKDKQAKFTGWKAGKGRNVGWVGLTADELGKLLNLQVDEDHEFKYFWFDSKMIGCMTVVSDTRLSLAISDIYVECDANRAQAFKEILHLIIDHLPEDVPCSLEDEIDTDRAARLQRENPLLGPF